MTFPNFTLAEQLRYLAVGIEERQSMQPDIWCKNIRKLAVKAEVLESALAEAKPKAYAFDKLFATLNELEPCDMTATDVLENMGKYFAEGLEATQ
ncbi:MAG: hypothetical protein WC495_06350 [Patescibacteria group bacterium]